MRFHANNTISVATYRRATARSRRMSAWLGIPRATALHLDKDDLKQIA
jgi:hypothetical protein